VDWFYNNLQERGDCQTTRKPYKTTRIVGWVVGWKIPTALAIVRFLNFSTSVEMPSLRPSGDRKLLVDRLHGDFPQADSNPTQRYLKF